MLNVISCLVHYSLHGTMRPRDSPALMQIPLMQFLHSCTWISFPPSSSATEGCPRTFLSLWLNSSRRNFRNYFEYLKRIREEFQRSKKIGNPKWAMKLPRHSKKESTGDVSDEEDIDNAVADLTQSAGKYIDKSKLLPKGVISVTCLNNITQGHRFGKLAIRAVQFHPERPVLMIAGENGIISLFEVGLPKSKESFLQDICFKNFPVTKAAFSSDGLKIIAGSRKQEYMFSYNLLDGKVLQLRLPKGVTKMNAGNFALSDDGRYMSVVTRNEIHIITVSSMEYIAYSVAPRYVISTQFLSSSSNIVYAMTENGEVLFWDIRKAGRLKSFMDEGVIRSTTMRISRNNQYIACGSNSGIVNIYDMSQIHCNQAPRPVRTFNQLTTSIKHLTFNNDSQILAFSSNIKENAIRLAHVRSLKVFSNFPSFNNHIGKPTTVDFSPNSGYMAIGDEKNFVNLFKLNYFERY
ncbi:unnamed protein product [Dracunculus medinensis]|uniref:WD_REPEATS_REGION domain-containing protein n=1 Tax=Dracunculus medinensis TaxID=318479 RepID=A0A0N4UIL3_DRAME|nr:unnamed protein product [Dracunculus medinensis]